MIAIHEWKGSFSDKWIEYCKLNNIKYKIINCYDNDIIEQIKECDIILWHWHHTLTRDALFAKELIKSFELMGKKVFPNIDTCWHYDDKIGQKYLFESLNLPLINTYVFYHKNEALKWIEETTFPKIFKLRGGAGAKNVFMCKTKQDAIKKINQIFSNGFSSRNRFLSIKERLWFFKRDKTLKSFLNIAKGLARIFIPSESDKNATIEKNYAYFQDFIPQNDSDIRVIVIGDKAFAIKRMVRNGDFRASGSGKILYNKDEIPLDCIKISFDTTTKIRAQSAAYDFVFLDNKPLLIEVSFAFAREGYLDCPGYWDKDLNWTQEKFNPEYFMIENIIKGK
jgi:glutathione synthase/RimK-type ligase-like ATP-grasp enzyme